MGVPTMYIGLLAAARADERRPVLRIAVSGGASLPVAVIDKFAEVFGADIYEGYGLSETSPVATFNQPVFGRKPGTVGRAIWGTDAGDRGRRDRGPDRAAAAGRDRRGGDARAQRVRRLPQQPGGHRGGAGRRVVPLR